MEINWKKNTAFFVAGQTLSLFGTLLVQYAILWHITLKTQSGSMMTVFTIAGFLPMFFISPFAGVWADRFNRKNIINIADGSIALVSLIMAVFLLFGYDSITILLICAVVRSLGQGTQMPAVGALLPQIVPQENLTKVNGLLSSIQAGTTLAAPMASGALMTFAPLEILFFVDVITAVTGIGILIFFVKVPALEKRGEENKKIEYFIDLKEGFHYIKKHGYILQLVLLSSVFMICASPSGFLTPLQVIRDFGSEVWRLTAIEITFSIGMMAGGIFIGAWGGFKNRVNTMALAVAMYGLGVIGLGLVNNFFVYIAIFAGIGITMPLFNTPIVVLFQSKVDSAFMGRVFSVFGMASSVLMPLSMVVFGPLSDIVAIDQILIGTGIAIALLCIPFMTSKTLREAGRSLDQPIESANDPASQKFYHGTKADLKQGDLIESGFNSNYGKRKKASYIYLTATLDAAIWGAELALGEGRGRIYTVEPTGAFEDDPNLTDKKFPGNPTKSYRSKVPLRVTGEITDWQGHSPEQLKAMKDHLEQLKQLGVEAIED